MVEFRPLIIDLGRYRFFGGAIEEHSGALGKIHLESRSLTEEVEDFLDGNHVLGRQMAQANEVVGVQGERRNLASRVQGVGSLCPPQAGLDGPLRRQPGRTAAARGDHPAADLVGARLVALAVH